MYEVWSTDEPKAAKVAEVATLDEAKAYVKKHTGHASYAIKLPTGAWYNMLDAEDNAR
jgi:hypothetical protein